MRLAFIGFRHAHIMGLYAAARRHPDVQVVAACEEHAPVAARLRSEGNVEITHDCYTRMLDEVPCDAVAVGDCYGRRGAIIIEALARGLHVISDKPICTRREELSAIAALSQQKRLCVGCLLDMRGSGAMRTVRRLISEGAIGPVHAVNFTAQHPLLYGTRPMWYFEPGVHGGTINDIGIHAFDIIPHVTGRRIAAVVAARVWNARLAEHPHFQDGAQMMLRLDNGGGVLGDMSYLAPDGCGYVLPQYWRMTFWGSGGMIEYRGDNAPVLLAQHADKQPRQVSPEQTVPDAPLRAFLSEVSGGQASPSTADVLRASRLALETQHAAETGQRDLEIQQS